MATMDFQHMDVDQKSHWLDILCSHPGAEEKEALSDRATVVKSLVEEYPFIDTADILTTKEAIPDDEIWCELFGLPDGWIRRFGLDFLRDLKEAALHCGRYAEFKATQWKEKFGGLRAYFTFTTESIDDVITKYEFLSERVCVSCGNDAKWVSAGWVCPYCDDCKNKLEGKKIFRDIETWCGKSGRDRFMMSFKPSADKAYTHNMTKSIWDWKASRWSLYSEIHETDYAFEKRHEFIHKLDELNIEKVKELLKEYDKYLY